MDHYTTILRRHDHELSVLKKFRMGQIDTAEMREYYREQSQKLEEYIEDYRPHMLGIWIHFILFAAGVLLIVLA